MDEDGTNDLLGTSPSEYVASNRKRTMKSVVTAGQEQPSERGVAARTTQHISPPTIYLSLMYLQFIFAVLLQILSTGSAFLGGHLTKTLFHARLSISTSVEEEVDIHDLQAELNTAGLNLCFGILHSSGVRELSDIQYLTEEQIVDMGIDAFDKRNIERVKEKLSKRSNGDAGGKIPRELSTHRDGKCYYDSFLLPSSAILI
jgi:hypothetical protein